MKVTKTYRKFSHSFQKTSVFVKKCDNIVKLVASIGGTDKEKEVSLTRIMGDNGRSDEYFKFEYEYYIEGKRFEVDFRLEYDKSPKKLTFSVDTDTYSDNADSYLGRQDITVTDIDEFFAGLPELIKTTLDNYLARFKEYLRKTSNDETAIVIDTMDTIARWKAKYEPQGFDVTMEPNDPEGYMIRVVNREDPDKEYLEADTYTMDISDNDGIFERFMDCIEDEGYRTYERFKDVNSLFKGIEKFVDGALKLKKMAAKCKTSLNGLRTETDDGDDDD